VFANCRAYLECRALVNFRIVVGLGVASAPGGRFTRNRHIRLIFELSSRSLPPVRHPPGPPPMGQERGDPMPMADNPSQDNPAAQASDIRPPAGYDPPQRNGRNRLKSLGISGRGCSSYPRSKEWSYTSVRMVRVLPLLRHSSIELPNLGSLSKSLLEPRV